MSTRTGLRGAATLAAFVGILVLASVGTCSAQPAAGYWDVFDYPDGAFPDWWRWTGYSEGGGSFLVYDGAFVHVEGGAAYYYRESGWANRNLEGYYDFLAKDSYWVFAWRISSVDPTAGRCLWLSHDDLSGSWAYTFAECSWENLDPGEYPDGQFMWHNVTVLRSVQYSVSGPLVGWHSVRIREKGPQALGLEIHVDDDLIFDESYEYIPDGHQGFGCLAGGEMSPALDSLWAQWPDSVEDETWGHVKALYR